MPAQRRASILVTPNTELSAPPKTAAKNEITPIRPTITLTTCIIFDIFIYFLLLINFYNFLALILSEFETTETLENAIANPANTGLSNHPKNG